MKKGFTLIEIMIVISIVLILIAIALPNFHNKHANKIYTIQYIDPSGERHTYTSNDCEYLEYVIEFTDRETRTKRTLPMSNVSIEERIVK